MKFRTEYLYSLANASITLRVIEYLRDRHRLSLDSVTVINLIDGWLIKVKLKASIDFESAKNLQAFLAEMGIPYQPTALIATTLAALESGECPTKVMNRYRVVIVLHGKPEQEEIEIFRQQIIERLGYCPQNMA